MGVHKKSGIKSLALKSGFEVKGFSKVCLNRRQLWKPPSCWCCTEFVRVTRLSPQVVCAPEPVCGFRLFFLMLLTGAICPTPLPITLLLTCRVFFCNYRRHCAARCLPGPNGLWLLHQASVPWSGPLQPKQWRKTLCGDPAKGPRGRQSFLWSIHYPTASIPGPHPKCPGKQPEHVPQQCHSQGSGY